MAVVSFPVRSLVCPGREPQNVHHSLLPHGKSTGFSFAFFIITPVGTTPRLMISSGARISCRRLFAHACFVNLHFEASGKVLKLSA